MEKFNATDFKALQQAMYPFGEWYEVIRKKVEQYDDSGRFNPIEVKERIFGSIQEGVRTLNVSGNGNGENEWEKATYTLTLVKPQYVSTGDIIITRMFGRLKVLGKSSNSNLRGTSSYDLVRTSTADNTKNDTDYVY